MTRKTVSNEFNEYCSFHYSKIKTVLLNDRVTTQYKKLPNIRPDFIYVDGQASTYKRKINGLNTKHRDRLQYLRTSF